MIRALALMLLVALPVRAETIVAGLSQNIVSITTDFSGSELLIYGAVKRDAPIPAGKPLEVIITVQGPSRALTVRRKERRFGIWMNTESVPRCKKACRKPRTCVKRSPSRRPSTRSASQRMPPTPRIFWMR